MRLFSLFTKVWRKCVDIYHCLGSDEEDRFNSFLISLESDTFTSYSPLRTQNFERNYFSINLLKLVDDTVGAL
jgi:hypothetical protein